MFSHIIYGVGFVQCKNTSECINGIIYTWYIIWKNKHNVVDSTKVQQVASCCCGCPALHHVVFSNFLLLMLLFSCNITVLFIFFV